MSYYYPWNGDMAALEHERERLNGCLYDGIRAYGESIRDELAIIADMNPVRRAQHALVFAMVSPRCLFAKNVAATPSLVRALDRSNVNIYEVESILRRNGIGLAQTKAGYLAGIAPFLRTMRADTVDRSMLLALRGAGYKVASMAIALMDADAPVFTLDSHMLAHITAENVNACTARQYRALECWLLNLVRDQTTVSPFFAQWALWSVFRGSFDSHLPIFGEWYIQE